MSNELTKIVESCTVCQHYLSRRIAVLAPHLCRRADELGWPTPAFTFSYMLKVHRRHKAGQTLSTRPCTENTAAAGPGRPGTIHTKRICNGCGENLGDVTTAEINAAVDGRALPDFRLECGCWTPAAA